MPIAFRFPKPSEYGTVAAVKRSHCVCGIRYRVLQRPVFVTTESGELLLIYKVGQLICDACLMRNAQQQHLQIHLS
jgi:hypothetical protein